MNADFIFFPLFPYYMSTTSCVFTCFTWHFGKWLCERVWAVVLFLSVTLTLCSFVMSWHCLLHICPIGTCTFCYNDALPQRLWQNKIFVCLWQKKWRWADATVIWGWSRQWLPKPVVKGTGGRQEILKFNLGQQRGWIFYISATEQLPLL